MAINSETVANVLSESINLVGLDDRSYAPRFFGPTGVIDVISGDTKPKTIMQIGRWKTDRVFCERFVYSLVQEDYTDDILTFEGV